MNKPRLAINALAACAAGLAGPAWAHPGHGLGNGSHWHAGDAWVWLLALAAAGLLAWAARRR